MTRSKASRAGTTKGFEAKRRIAVLQFEGEDYEGCEVRCLFDISLGDLLYFDKLGVDPAKNEEAMRRFGDSFLESWNYEIKGEPVPATGEGILRVPAPFALLLLNKWREAMAEIAGVPDPLGDQSKNGATSEEQSVMTGAKSSDLASSSAPNS